MGADASQNILITFEADPSGLQPGIDGLVQTGKVGADVAASFNKTNDAINQNAKSIQNNSSAIQSFVQNLNNASRATAGAFGSKVVQDFTNQINGSVTSVKNLQSIVTIAKQNLLQFKPNTQEWQQWNAIVLQGDSLLKSYGQTTESTAGHTGNLLTQLRQMRFALQEMDQAGQSDTQAFKDLSAQAAQLEQGIGRTQTRIHNMASETGGINALVEGFSTLTAGVQIFEGVSALAGQKNEDLQQTLIKLNAVMNLAAGIQQIVNNLREQSILRIKAEAIAEGIMNFIRTGSFKAIQQNVAATEGDIAVKEADTVATTELAVATEASSFAMQAFRVALIATGIGAVVVLVGALVNALSNFTSNTKDAAKAENDFNETLIKTNESLQAQIDFIAKSSDSSIKSIQTDLDLAEKRGASETELFAIRERLYKQQLAIAQQQQDAAIKQAEREDVNVSNGVKGYAALQNAADIYFHSQDALNNQRLNDLADLAAAQKSGDDKAIKSANDRLTATETDLKKTQSAYDIYSKALTGVSDTEISLDELTAEKSKYYNDLKTKDAAANAQALLNIQQRALQTTADFYKKISQNPSFGSQIQTDALQKSLDAQKQMLLNEEQFELQKEGLTALQKLDIIDKYNVGVANLTQQGYDERNKIIQQSNAQQEQDDQKTYNDLLAQEKKFIDDLNKSVDNQFAKIAQNNSAEQVQRLGDLEAEYQAGNISLTQFLQQRETINKEFAQRDLNNQIAALQAKISNDTALGISTDDLQKQLNEKLKEKYDQDAQNYSDAEKKKSDAAKAETDKRQAIQQAEFQIASTLISGFFQAQSQLYQNQEQEVQDLASKKLISEQETQKRIAAIHKQQAIAGKEEALFNIAINVAQAITKDLAGNKFLIPFDIAMGVIQAGIVLAAPLPKFKSGKVKIDGPGTETSDSIFAMLSKNESVINAEATKRYQPALEAMNELRFEDYVLKNFNLPQINFPVPSDIPASAMESVYHSHTEIDYERLADVLATKITEKQGKISDTPQSGISFDENGVRMWMKKQDELDIYLNKKYGYTRS